MWDVTPSSLVEIYRRFEVIFVSCLVCIAVILWAFVVLCVYCCFYFRCRTAG